jgi:predicted DNA-binding transcriptional regulator YafY
MKTKHPFARIKIIDRELIKNQRVKTKDLVRIISEEDLPVTQRTVQNDINHMKENWPTGYSAPIEFDTKTKSYYYTDPNFTIQAFGLKSDDILALSFYARTLEQYKGFKFFENILMAIEKVVNNISVTKSIRERVANKPLLLTEKITINKGNEFIDPILKAILEEQEITFDYQKFEDQAPQHRKFAPILLKEDKNFWYVIGTIPGKQELTTFALDRISNLVVTNNYFTPVTIDIEDYFKYSFGITVSSEKPIKIVLSFNYHQGKYIKAVPIHGTQNIIKDNKEELRISVMVKPSYEFYSKILSYGEDVKIISPKSIAQQLKDRLRLAYRNYK